MIILAILFFLIISALNLRLGFLVLIALLPTYLIRFQIGPLPTTFLEIMTGIIMVVFIFRGALANNPKFAWLGKKIYNFPNHPPINILIALFLIAATIGIFVSSEIQAALGIWKAYFLEPIILFFIFISLFSKKDLCKIIWAIAISALLVSSIAIFQKFTGWNVPFEFWGKDNVFRVTSFYGFPNALGLYLAPIIPFLIFYIIKSVSLADSKRNALLRQFPIIIIFIMSLLAIIWAKSTGALIGLSAGLLFTALFYRRLRLLAILAIMIIASLFFLNIIPAEITRDLLLQDWSGQVRIKMWSETATMLTANWKSALLGVGLSAYPVAVAQFHIWDFVEIFQYPHNFILNFWSELGLLGLLTFFGLILLFFKKTLLLCPKNCAKKIFAPCDNKIFFFLAWSMSTILIHGIVDVPYFKNDLSIFFWLLFGLLIIHKKNTVSDFH